MRRRATIRPIFGLLLAFLMAMGGTGAWASMRCGGTCEGHRVQTTDDGCCPKQQAEVPNCPCCIASQTAPEPPTATLAAPVEFAGIVAILPARLVFQATEIDSEVEYPAVRGHDPPRPGKRAPDLGRAPPKA